MRIIEHLRSSHSYRRLAELRPRLYRSALAWCGSPHQADDLVQEALSKALKKIERLKDPDALDAWAFSILVNCFRDHCRSRQPLAEHRDLVDEVQMSAEELLESEQRIRRVRRAIGMLGQGQREVIALVDLEGFSYAEVAQILKIPMGTVMSRLNRARQRLKQLLIENRWPVGHKGSHLERVK